MGEAALDHRLSVEAYLAMEAEAELRHEYHAGEIFAMAGGTRRHGKLGANLITELTLIERKNGCTTFNGDVRVWIGQDKRFLYPEASVVCGEVEPSPEDTESITNPILVAEVLSESSEAYDRGKKFAYYRSLPSLREYALIDQQQPLVEIFYRRSDNVWEMREVRGLDQTIQLQSLEAEIKMADLYQNVEELEGLD